MKSARRIYYDDLKGMRIVDKNQEPVGKIIDAIISEDMTLSSFILGGSFIEEKLEDLGLRPDDDPIVPVSSIKDLGAELVMNIDRSELASTIDTGAIKDNETRLSDLKKKEILDTNNELVGEITNFFITNYEDTRDVEYIIGGDKLNPYLKTMQGISNMAYCCPSKSISHVGDKLVINQTLDDLEFKLKRDFRHAFYDAFEAAYADGKVTEEEKKILDKLAAEVEVYQEALAAASEDGIITKAEEDALDAHREEIIHNLVMVAKDDEVISKDEAQIIQRLSAYLIDNKKVRFWKVFGTHKS